MPQVPATRLGARNSDIAGTSAATGGAAIVEATSGNG
jgi:hypothetical protein